MAPYGQGNTVPPELAHLGELQNLDLGGNELTGLIPPELGALSRLRTLRLSENDLGGPVPPELWTIS